jgi:hypothetical protein
MTVDQKPVPRYRARATSKARVRKLVLKALDEGKPWPRDRIDARWWAYAEALAGGRA